MLGVKKVSVRIDTGIKGEFERVLDGIGLDSTNAMRCFAFQIARKESFPFEPSNRIRNEWQNHGDVLQGCRKGCRRCGRCSARPRHELLLSGKASRSSNYRRRRHPVQGGRLA